MKSGWKATLALKMPSAEMMTSILAKFLTEFKSLKAQELNKKLLENGNGNAGDGEELVSRDKRELSRAQWILSFIFIFISFLFVILGVFALHLATGGIVLLAIGGVILGVMFALYVHGVYQAQKKGVRPGYARV